MKVKNCSVCKKNKDINLFNKKKKSKDGYQNVCKDCNSEIGKIHYTNNKVKINKRTRDREKRIIPLAQEIILFHLKDGCVDCGEKDIVVLDFDHLHNKEYSIAYMMQNAYSLEKLEAEISKCVVRCANCHRRKTAKDFNWWRLKV